MSDATEIQIEMQCNNTIGFDNVCGVLCYIQKQLKVSKGKYNAFSKFNYRSCEDILEAVKKILPEDCCLIIDDDISLIGDRHYVKATAQLIYKNGTISTSAFARESVNKKGFDEAQLTGASSSYARKYALNGLFLIDDTEDVDSKNNNETEKATIKAIPKANNKFEIMQQLSKLCHEKNITHGTIEKWHAYFKVDSLNDLNENQLLDIIAKIKDKK